MVELVEVAKINELKEGSIKVALAKGNEILLVRSGDRYYAANNHCTHMGGRLSQGELTGTVVTCPRHGSQFDLRDDTVVRWFKGSGLAAWIGRTLRSPWPIDIYEVKVTDNNVCIEA